jgi:DNA-directed RNA polymerase subunit RPC12/RpoP
MQGSIECRKQMYDLRQRGKGRLKAFCGVHLIKGWAECADCWKTFKIEDQDRDGVLNCPDCKSANVIKKGVFARRRAGVVANWHPDVRQSLYQLGDQFNRRPKSEWGQRLRKEKARYREQYPEKITQNGKSRYSDGHIHRMATWRTLTKFVEELYDQWTHIERNTAKQEPVTS